MHKKFNFHFFLLGLTGIILWCTSCVKVDFSKETQKATPKLFTNGATVPSDFKWSSVKTIDFRVTVDDKFAGKYFYRLELFDNDPKLGTKANLLGAGVAKKGQDFTGKIVIPTLSQYVYLKQTSPVGIVSVTMLKTAGVTSLIASPNGLREGNISTFSSSRIASPTDSSSRIASPTDVVVPPAALPLTGGATVVVESGKSYVIKSGITFTGQINANNGTTGVKIYVEGTWTNKSYTMTLGNNNALYTTASGKIDLNNVIQNTEGAFLNYGTASLADLSTSNQALYVNYGTLTATKATFSNGSFTNFGTATFQSLKSTTATTKIRNEGNLTVTTADLTNATLEAACYTKIGTLITNTAIVNVIDKAILTITNVDGSGTKYNIASGGILEITGIAEFSSNRNYINGPSTGKALARLKKVDVTKQWQAITYGGNLEVACSDHTPNGEWSTYYIVESPATIVAFDKSTVVIAGTTCNAGGNNDKGAGTTPTDQTVSEINLGTFSYAFEDNWPELGDYDMNDVVVDMNIVKYQNTSNKTTKVILKGSLISVGASKRNSIAVQLDGIPTGSVKSVTYSRINLVGNNLKLGSNGVESGQTNAVVTIVDDAHKAFGVSDTPFISTQNGGSHKPVDVVITIEFTTPLDNFTYQTLNMFIINNTENSTGRSEVHMVGYAATDKIDKRLIENMTGSKLSSDPFKSVNNEPWALSTPISFSYPLEGKNVKESYTKFESWAVSGGIKDTDWYLSKK
ncbi:LruC domain-containing protein [Emticicia sp. C21]|uniref:LruC domain-containing protein n=1 Tax=Emticicia sp. C21 TaxID=2302915 RepID=UPI00131493B9|nr:LruC domain-containing protein [Emticicia sp. C21]